jgi:hypothetical protein
MNEDYLWDRSGPPDPEIDKLEAVLAGLRYRHRAELVQPPRPARAWSMAAAAAVLAAIALSQIRVAPGPVTAWQIASIEGAARLGSRNAGIAMPVRAGQVLRTGQAAEVTLESDALGRVDIGPQSEMRASGTRSLMLNRGRLHAFIWAPPREFVVDTPSARAVDLGCEYTLQVDPSGDGLLRVSLGWVAFQYAGHEAFIPAGAECVTRKRQGPGIPYFEDAPLAFREALARYESGQAAALSTVLEVARSRDGLTLWHLLTRVPTLQRAAVFDRFAQLESLPSEIKRDAAIRNDPHTIDLCWNALNLENTSWWRGWERNW